MGNNDGASIPFRKRQDIWNEVERFRGKYELAQKIPVDILYLAERDLGVLFEPIPSLKSVGDIDAMLLADLRTIAVDDTAFMEPRFYNRIRFSVAHEIGHIVLHAQYVLKHRPKHLHDIYQLVDTMPEDVYQTAEYQAYEFAGRLLVQRDVLEQEIRKKEAMIISYLTAGIDLDLDSLPAYISTGIGKLFEVSDQVIERRIRNEGLLQPYLDRHGS